MRSCCIPFFSLFSSHRPAHLEATDAALPGSDVARVGEERGASPVVTPIRAHGASDADELRLARRVQAKFSL